MTTFQEVIAGENQLVVLWTPPRFYPDHYKQTISCRLLCNQRTYYLKETMVNGMEKLTTSNALMPGSVCLIKMVAVYNPASIDPGIGLVAHTRYTSRYINVHLLSTFWYMYMYIL